MEVKQGEKRRFTRVKLKAPLRLQARGGHEFNNVLSEDISLGGLSLVCEDFISPQTNLMLEFNLLSHRLAPVGRVVWSSPLIHSNRYRLGVEFIEFEPLEKNYLKDFIDLQHSNL